MHNSEMVISSYYHGQMQYTEKNFIYLDIYMTTRFYIQIYTQYNFIKFPWRQGPISP
jgi:hypothetical protein